MLALVLCASLMGGAATAVESPLARGSTVSLRVLSWNVGAHRLFASIEEHRALLRLADADILLLDEVAGGRSREEVAAILGEPGDKGERPWNVVIGMAGGPQRGAIASRYPLQPVKELDGLRYPQKAFEQLRALVAESRWSDVKNNLDTGLPAMGAIVRVGNHSVLAVTVDLQCCNGMPDWQEARRRIEVREIRRAVGEALSSHDVDAVVLAGDFNLVSGATPLVAITNPYPPPHFALAPVDAVHLDGTETWTWDGRETPYPSRALDASLYSP